MLGNRFKMEHNIMKIRHSMDVEFMYDLDVLEMIRFFPYTPFFQGIGPPGPYPCIESYKDCGSGPYDECDDSLMVTSNDALRFEEDCLFESPSPSCSNIQSHHNSSSSSSSRRISDATADSNRFLCQRNFMADMTLAELNDTCSSDVFHKAKTSVAKTRMQNLDQNFDPSDDSLLASSSKAVGCTSIKKEVASMKSIPPKQTSPGGAFVIKIEQDLNEELKYENKTEQISQAKKVIASLKRPHTSSVTLNELDTKDNRQPIYQHSETVSAFSSSMPLEKKLKYEITDTDCDQVNSDAAESPSGNEISDADSSDELSDAESVISKGSSVSDLRKANSGDRRFFWQYNIQAKGPKKKKVPTATLR